MVASCIVVVGILLSGPVPTSADTGDPASGTDIVVPRSTTAVTVDGALGEFSGTSPLTFTVGNGSVSAYTLWDATALYIGFAVGDGDQRAGATTRDGAAWLDDSVEWFVDTQNDKAGSLQPDDYHGIVNLLNTAYDERGTDSTWNGSWRSAVKTRSDGYTIEISIPWSTLGVAPAASMEIGLGLAVNDADSSSRSQSPFENSSKAQPLGSGPPSQAQDVASDRHSQTGSQILYPDTTGGFQRPSVWPTAALEGGDVLGGATPATPGMPGSTFCHVYGSSAAVPEGYGATYNVFSSAKEVLLTAACAASSALIEVGTGDRTQYIYRYGYEWKNGAWQEIEFTGSDIVADAWIPGKARASLARTREEMGATNYYLAYVCTWSGGAWKCGCRDEACVQSRWQLQAFSGTADDGGADDGTGGDGDTTPSDAPVISSVKSSGITRSQAYVEWDVDPASTGQVEYGTSTSYGSVSGREVEYLPYHKQMLSNLSPGTTYHFRIRGQDAQGNEVVSQDQTFTTESSGDTAGNTGGDNTGGGGNAGGSTVSCSGGGKSVKDYGAKGDGGTNDTTAIERALAENTDVLIPAGTYLVSDLDIPSGKTICGYAATVKLLPNQTGMIPVIDLGKSSDIKIYGLTVDGNRSAGNDKNTGPTFPEDGGNHGIRSYGADDVVLQDMIIKNAGSDGMLLDNNLGRPSTNFTVSNTLFDNNTRQGVSIIDAENVTFTDVAFRNTNGKLPSAGVDLEPDGISESIINFRCTRCEFSNNEGAGLMTDIIGGDLRGFVVEDSQFFGNNNDYLGWDMDLQIAGRTRSGSTALLEDITIKNNVLTKTSYVGGSGGTTANIKNLLYENNKIGGQVYFQNAASVSGAVFHNNCIRGGLDRAGYGGITEAGTTKDCSTATSPLDVPR